MPGKGSSAGGADVRENQSPKVRANRFADGESGRNALGQEISYAGVKQDVSNSRIFGIRKELPTWNQQSDDTRAGYMETLFQQMRGVSNGSTGSFGQRATRDTGKLWGQTPQSTRDAMARQFDGYTQHPNPAVRSIYRQLDRRQKQLQEQDRAARKARRSSNSGSKAELPGLEGLMF